MRCCCPPESLPGKALSLSPRPTCSSCLTASASASCLLLPNTLRGASMTFSSTVRWGKAFHCWKTMPIFCRSRLRSVALSWTSTPSTRMLPFWIGSRPLMHISRVDLPEPEPPMIDTTSPLSTVRLTPLTTSRLPKDLCTLSISIIFLPPSFQTSAQACDHQAHDVVDKARDAQHQQRFLDAGDDGLRGAQQFDDADPHHQRGVFHYPEHQVQPAGERHSGGHRQDDPAQVLQEAQPQRTAGPAHGERHRQHASPHDLGEVRRRVNPQHNAADAKGADVQTDDTFER